MTAAEIHALADLAESKPRFFSACRWGFHRMAQVEQLLTTGRAVCVDRGEVWMTSLFGDFPESRADSAAWLRAQAGEAGTAETVKQGSVHEHAVPEGNAP